MEQEKEIPQTIQEHLGSPKTILIIQSINDRVDIARINIIPSVIKKLIIKEITPKELVKKVSEYTRFGEERSFAITKEIKEKILKPIEYALLNWGIDIKDIDTTGAKTIEEIKKEEEDLLVSVGVKIEKPTTTISLEQSPDEGVFSPAKIQVSGDTDLSSKKIQVTDEPAPLVIHREKPRETQEKGSSQQARGFSMPFGFFKQKTIRTEPARAPVKATIEFFKKDEPKRAVDYNELRTPLTPFAKEERFIQTEKNQNTNQPKERVFSQTQKEPTKNQIPIQKINPIIDSRAKPDSVFVKNDTNNTSQQPIVESSTPNKINPLVLFDKKQTKNDEQKIIAPPSSFGTKPQGLSEQKINGGVEIKKEEEKAVVPTTSSGVLDIRGIKVDQKTPTVSQINTQTPNKKEGGSEIKNEGWGFFRKKQNTNNAPKQEVKIEAQKTSITSQQTQNENKKPDTQKTPQITNTVVQNKAEHTKNGAGFVWFKKPEQKEQKTTKIDTTNNTEKNPKIEGNIIDLRQTNNNDN